MTGHRRAEPTPFFEPGHDGKRVRRQGISSRPFLPSEQNIENNPMHSSQVAAGAGVFCYPEKSFDTSGKSALQVYHPDI
jgi:hypothetical protein